MPGVDELERIRRSIDALSDPPGWDWNSFVSTLIATLVGAAVASAVTIWVLRRQRKDQYEQSIREASTRCVGAVLKLARRDEAGEASANRIEVRAELHLLSGIMNDEDRPFANALIKLVDSLGTSKDPTAVGLVVGTAAAALGAYLQRNRSTSSHVKQLATSRKELEKRLSELDVD